MYYATDRAPRPYLQPLSDEELEAEWATFCQYYDIRYVGGEIRHAGELIRSEMERRGLPTDVHHPR